MRDAFASVALRQAQDLLCKATTQGHRLQAEEASLTSPRWLHEKLMLVREVF